MLPQQVHSETFADVELAKGPLQEESDGIVERDHNPFVECCG